MFSTFNKQIGDMILLELDNWKQNISSKDKDEDDLNSFDNNINNDIQVNKEIKPDELEYFFKNSFLEALNITRRQNLDDLFEYDKEIFMLGVYKLTASRLWQKYNIRVSNENLEDNYTESFGGKLEKEAINILKTYTKSITIGLSRLNEKRERKMNEINHLRDNNIQLEAKILNLEKTLSDNKEEIEKIKTLETIITDIKAEKTELLGKIQELEEIIRKLGLEKDEERNFLDKIILEYKNRIEELKKELFDLNKSYEGLKKEYETHKKCSTEEIQTFKDKIQELETFINTSSLDKEKMTREYDAKVEKHHQDQLSLIKKTKDAIIRLNNLEEENENLKEEIKKLKKHIDNLSNLEIINDRLRDKIKTLEEEKTELFESKDDL